jgi:hypothetical protein
MTHAYPAWEFAADTHLVKWQRLQNKVLRTIGKFPKQKPVRLQHSASTNRATACPYIAK